MCHVVAHDKLQNYITVFHGFRMCVLLACRRQHSAYTCRAWLKRDSDLKFLGSATYILNMSNTTIQNIPRHNHCDYYTYFKFNININQQNKTKNTLFSSCFIWSSIFSKRRLIVNIITFINVIVSVWYNQTYISFVAR